MREIVKERLLKTPSILAALPYAYESIVLFQD